MEEAFQILAEEDVIREKQQQMKQQLSKQRRKSQQLCKIVKNDCWSDDEIESSGNYAQVQLNNMQIPYQLHCRSSMQCVRGKSPNFDILSLLKEESGLEEIILYKVIVEFHIGNVELKHGDFT